MVVEKSKASEHLRVRGEKFTGRANAGPNILGANQSKKADIVRSEIPGSGALFAKLPGEQKNVSVPLKHTDVKANVLGYISTVDVTQQYQNPYAEKIEAVYVFPLPQDAAVSDFIMTIGDRKIRGIIREKEEAKRIYEAARSQGYVASLLTQDRPNIFTQSVANIEPGKQIDVNIRYFNTLQYVDGWYEFVFPMVVGPRFNPPGYTEGIGAVGRGNPGVSGQTKEVQYLRPNERSGHDISLSVNLNPGVTIERIESVNHRVVQTIANGATQVSLSADDTIPNKDFVLRFKVAGQRMKSALITQRDERGGFFTLMLYPPDSLKDIPRTPLEMVFTLDVSGSMSGQPIEQSRAAIRYALAHMRGDDTFQIIRFAGNTEEMSERPLPATPENIQRALGYINTMEAGGGTMMLEGIKRSLNFPATKAACDTSRSLPTDSSATRRISWLRSANRAAMRDCSASASVHRPTATCSTAWPGSARGRLLI
jgi:Ca-activated chloride channel family protein